ncbi:membrane fusion protein [Janthinobacterium sp. CG_23.3]|uniref:HlyD family secretion protein n=1 Tax=Janthinobacterium sp. CG_23.3 TaxID=3349634 RepID=UPI0038D36D05
MASSLASQPLFRPEVTTAHSQQWLGTIRLAQPISSWLIAGIATVIATSLVAYVSLGSVTKKTRVTGITLPIGGSISITTANAGLLMRSYVSEGQAVRAGQILFELSTERQGDHGEITSLIAMQLATRQQTLETEQRLRLAQHNEKKQAFAKRISNLNTEVSQLEQEIILMQKRHDMAQVSVNKYQTLQSEGYVSSAQTQQKQEDLIDVSARMSILQRNKLQLQANLLASHAEQAALDNTLATDQMQLQRALASLQQEVAENRNRKASLITASQAGTITTLTSQAGQNINAGQVLATLIPPPPGGAQNTDKDIGSANSLLEVHLYAPSRTAGFVAGGQHVLIRYQAFPYQKFGLQQGTVTDVSKTPFAPGELPANLASTILSNAQQNVLGFNSNEALYRIKVKLDKQSISAYGLPQALKPGMTLEADVLQERRKIWEWILEPVLAVSQTL